MTESGGEEQLPKEVRESYNCKIVVGMIGRFSHANSVWLLLRTARLGIRLPMLET
jgi:hypothetical protein